MLNITIKCCATCNQYDDGAHHIILLEGYMNKRNGISALPAEREWTVKRMSDMTIQNAIHCMKAMICEEVCEECDYYGKTGTDHCEADAVRMSIKALEEQPYWIPCSERFPKEGQECLVCDHGTILIDTFLGHGNPYNWKWYTRDYEAWMPLPEPYGGESE